MAFRQGSGSVPPVTGDHTIRSSRVHEIDLETNVGTGLSVAGTSNNPGSAARQAEGKLKGARVKKPVRKSRQSAGLYLVILLCVVGFTFLVSDYIGRAFITTSGDDGSKDWFFPDQFSEMHNPSGGNRKSKNRVEHEVRFGQLIRGREADRDSRDWDSDDRNRDIEGNFALEYDKFQKELEDIKRRSEVDDDDALPRRDGTEEQVSKIPGLSYEQNRKELHKYEKEYEANLLKESNSTEAENDLEEEAEDEYETNGDTESVLGRRGGKSVPVQDPGNQDQKKPSRGRRRKRGAACEINFANSTSLQEPEGKSKYAHFQLDYVKKEEMPIGDHSWRPKFAGHQTMEERESSFLATNQTVHCGFVQGPDPAESTGFDLEEADKEYMASCQVAVSSCIFGKSDQLHPPQRRKMSNSSKKEVCFVLFVDQQSLDVMLEEGQVPDENGLIGLWKVVVVKNLPYTDFRRVGKIPKFLSHRLFPSARYSIWLDSKLRLQSDPLSILEYFLRRGKHEYAISNHYDRHCVWDEVQQNKRLNKFDPSLIDEQFHFYQQDGLTKFNASDPKRLLPSNVPEGSFIVRAHTPMSNLFSCLWFNEIERFTPRDQLSFAYTYMKLVRTNPGTRFRFAMFKDCERRMIAKLYRHRQDDSRVVQ